MRWARISISAPSEASEAVAALLLDAGAHGTEHQPDGTVSAYLPVDDRLEGRILDLKSSLDRLPTLGLTPSRPSMSVVTIDADNWEESWKQYYHPTAIGAKLLVTPPWIDPPNPEGRIVLRINPGMAFGTGHHPSTRLCLCALEQLVRPGDIVADLGTGSGILAIASALLRAGAVIAADNDPQALLCARENLKANGVAHKILLIQADTPAVFRGANVMVANILAEVISAMAPDIPNALANEGTFIGSGIAKGQETGVRSALEAAGLRVHRVLSEEGWVAVVARKTH
ncbi:MAG: 50S ribosomal protein L11 methyltransferase [Armatimonadota bacterium]